MKNSSLPVVLTIAGSDNSAGAGIQADLKAITASGCYALTAVTCVVAEVPGHVFGIQPVQASLLAKQIRSCFEAFPVAAVKTGMLYSKSLIRVVVKELQHLRKSHPFHLVIDPVMIASSGDSLFCDDAVQLYRKELLPMADVVTPNLDELGFLSNAKPQNLQDMAACGTAMATLFQVPFLCKGGHLQGTEAVDLLIGHGEMRSFSAPFFRNAETHGTGCTYSAVIAAELAKGRDLGDAVGIAKEYITSAIGNAYQWGNTRALASGILISQENKGIALTVDR